MAEVPSAVFGRNLHEQQVQFYRADIIGGMTGDIYVGRVGRGTILLDGAIIVAEGFNAGTVQLFLGLDEIGTAVDLTATGKTVVTPEGVDMWNVPNPPNARAKYLAGCWDEYDLIARVNVATEETSGVATVYMLGIEHRVSNEIFTQYPFEDTSRMASVK